MTMNADHHDDLPQFSSITDMSRMLGLSRARLYQLLGSALPYPVYLVKNRRPAFTREQVKLCLAVRKRNQGINGLPIMFYARRGSGPTTAPRKPKKPRKTTTPSRHAHLIAGLSGLGLTDVKEKEVERAAAACS